jgi:hypothetical protein
MDQCRRSDGWKLGNATATFGGTSNVGGPRTGAQNTAVNRQRASRPTIATEGLKIARIVQADG